jgi:hypothetical protein
MNAPSFLGISVILVGGSFCSISCLEAVHAVVEILPLNGSSMRLFRVVGI